MYPRFIVFVLVVLPAACALGPERAKIEIGPPRQLDLAVAEDAWVDVRIPAGEVEIRGVPGDRLHAELVLKCPEGDRGCARRLGKVQLVSREADGRVGVRLSHNRSYRYRQGQVHATIEVPRSRQLAVNMSAGELRIRGVDACLSVDMGAGDVDIQAPADRVGRVALDAGIGDARLAVGGRRFEAPRSWLIGAELSWDQGPGPCELVVDLKAGDIEVELNSPGGGAQHAAKFAD